MITTLNEDCNEVMPRFPTMYFDLLDADPPYFSGPEKRKYYGNSVNKLNIKRIDYPVTDTWSIPDEKWFNEAKRISKNQIIWGANYFDFIGPVHKTPRRHELEEWLKEHPTGWIVWDKVNYDSSFNDYELAWTSFDIPTIVYRFMWNGMLQGKSISEGHIMQGDKSKNQKRIHPTEKPIMLYDWQWLTFCKQSFKVFFPYSGSFSDVISGWKYGFSEIVACELNKTHYDNGTERFKRIASQQNLFQAAS